MEINQFLDATYLKTAKQSGISEQENQLIVMNLLEEVILYDYKLDTIFNIICTFSHDYKLDTIFSIICIYVPSDFGIL